MTKLLIILVLSGVSLLAQSATAPTTKLNPSQVRKPVVPAPSIAVVLPSGAVIYARIDSATLELDTSVIPPILRAKTVPVAPPAYQGPTYYQLTRNPDGKSFTLPLQGKQVVAYRNGLLMVPNMDYTISGLILQFTADQGCCESDEVVVAAIYQ